MERSVFDSESYVKLYFTMAIPVVFSLVVTIVYNITDTYFIALTKNMDLVAGVSLCAPVFTLLMGFGNILGQGGSSLLSRLMGMNDCENLQRVSSFCFYIAILFGIAAGVIMLFLRVPILRLLGADDDTLPYALPYFTYFAAGAPAVTLSFIHTNLLRSEGMAKESMIGTIGGSVVNMILDPVLIFWMGLGAAGAAIATVIGYLFTDLYGLYLVLKKSRVLSIDFRKAWIKARYAVQIFTIGISAALSNITQSFCLVLTNHSLLPFGNDKIAAMGIVQKVSMIVMLVIVGFSFGGAPLIGYTYGSGNQERLKKLLGFILKFLCISALVLSVIMSLLAPVVLRGFIDEGEMLGTATLMLRTQVLGMVFMAVVLFMTIFFQATGKALPALVLALSRQGAVFAAVLFVAVHLFGYYGILFTQATADLLSALLAAVLFVRVNTREETKRED